jgi:NRE family putative nickel resistance protein-like MFS transporter
MIWTCFIRAVLVGTLPFTHAAWQAYALSFASSLFGPMFRPARAALLAQVAKEGELVPSLAVMETTHQVLHTVGPAMGGLAVLLVGARNAFFVDAASYVIAASFLTAVQSRGRPVQERGTTMQDLRGGMRALLTAPAIRAYALLNTALNLGFAGVIALLVVYVRDVNGRPAGQYGLILTVAGLGTVVSSLAIAARDPHHARTPWAVASAAGVGAFALAWFEPSFLWLVPIAFASGLADSGSWIPMEATIAEQLANEYRGRVHGSINALTELAAATGSLGFAWLGEASRLGPARAMALSGLTGAGLAAVVLMVGGAAAIARYERARLAGAQQRRDR